MIRLIRITNHLYPGKHLKAALFTAGMFMLSAGAVQAQYCTSNATSTGDEDILNVTFGTLNNSSTCATTGGTGSILNEYSDFTAITPPTITAGTTVPLSVEVGTCGGNYGNGVAVFIDYNRDNTFDPLTERVYGLAATTTGPHIETANIVIPSTISFGTTRMRVIVVEFSAGNTILPCGTYSWGETEDYTITLVPAGPPSCITAPLTPANASTGGCAGNTRLSWNAKVGAIGYDVYLDAGSGAPVTKIGNNIPDTFLVTTATAVPGLYTWKIVPKNNQGSATSCTNFTFSTTAGAVAGANVTINTDTLLCPYQVVTFTAAPISGGTAPSYQWKKNGVDVGTNSNVYTDNDIRNNDKVKVVVTSSLTGGCITALVGSSREINFTWKPVPANTVTASGRTTFCAGGSVVLSAPTGAAAYQWERNGVPIATNGTSSNYSAIYSGSYVAYITGSNGCSIRSNPDTVNAVDAPVANIVRNNDVLSTQSYFQSYQWYKDNVAIPGATSSTYTFSHDGQYRVTIVDTNGCAGGSSVIYVNNLAIDQFTVTPKVSIYPNPVIDIVKIDAADPMNIRITSIDGKQVMARKGVNEVNISNLADGIYTLYVSDKNNQMIVVQKLVKNSH